MDNEVLSNNQRSVTLDDLATMVKKGFDEMDDKFDGLNSKFEGLNSKFQGLEQKVDQRPTLAQIDLKLQNMEHRLKEDLGEKPLERDRVLNTKTNTVAHKLGHKAVFTAEEVKEIEHISPVAVSPV
ncbi:MAG: hypothetical protein AB1352_03465 [Patescibacteria group bacterium]